VKALEEELGQLNLHSQQRDASKDELIKSLQGELHVDIKATLDAN
jgi:hypothetical protein